MGQYALEDHDPNGRVNTICRETQMPPGDYIEAAHVEAARRILEEGNTSLKGATAKCGFSDQSDLRRAFIRRLQATPAEYRQTFCPGEARKG